MKVKRFSSDIVAGYSFWCPACEERHLYYTERFDGAQRPMWSFDNNLETPTFQPSLLLTTIRHKTMNEAEWLEYDKLVDEKGTDAALADPRFRYVCHLFVTSGKIIYCLDCTHAYAGKTVELPDLPERKYKNEI